MLFSSSVIQCIETSILQRLENEKVVQKLQVSQSLSPYPAREYLTIYGYNI